MKRTRAFTLVEVLAAMAFLGILMPVVISALLLSSRASAVAERTTVAVQLGQNKLNELLLDNAWSSENSSGDFGTEWPGYTWKLEDGTWDLGSMTELTLAVIFKVQGNEHRIQLTTLANTELNAQ